MLCWKLIIFGQQNTLGKKSTFLYSYIDLNDFYMIDLIYSYIDLNVDFLHWFKQKCFLSDLIGSNENVQAVELKCFAGG